MDIHNGHIQMKVTMGVTWVVELSCGLAAVTVDWHLARFTSETLNTNFVAWLHCGIKYLPAVKKY